jgi:hypothetical protein
MSAYRQTYSAMTDDQLLNLAQESETLLPEARSALNSELAKRSLGTSDVAEYADDVRRIQLSEAQQKPLAQTFNGFGTKIYGKRQFRADGSFLTTKWIVFFWIPLIPLKSLRVKDAGPGRGTVLPGWSRNYFVLSESHPDVRQVINIYMFISSFVIGTSILDFFHLGEVPAYCAFFVWACTPWILRRAEKERSSQRPNSVQRELNTDAGG